MGFDVWTVVASAAVSAIVSLVAVRAQTFRAGRAERELSARRLIDDRLRDTRREVLQHERARRGRPPREPNVAHADDGVLAYDLLAAAAAEAFGAVRRWFFRRHVRLIVGAVYVDAAEVYSRENMTTGVQVLVMSFLEGEHRSFTDGLLHRGLAAPSGSPAVRRLRRHLWRLSRSY